MITLPEDVYDALVRLALAHGRDRCVCENCPPDRPFMYDNCVCGEDWGTCEGDWTLITNHVPGAPPTQRAGNG